MWFQEFQFKVEEFLINNKGSQQLLLTAAKMKQLAIDFLNAKPLKNNYRTSICC